MWIPNLCNKAMKWILTLVPRRRRAGGFKMKKEVGNSEYWSRGLRWVSSNKLNICKMHYRVKMLRDRWTKHKWYWAITAKMLEELTKSNNVWRWTIRCNCFTTMSSRRPRLRWDRTMLCRALSKLTAFSAAMWRHRWERLRLLRRAWSRVINHSIIKSVWKILIWSISEHLNTNNRNKYRGKCCNTRAFRRCTKSSARWKMEASIAPISTSSQTVS